MAKLLVTTSWDDGHVLDLKLADLLSKYGIKGTFYISPKDREFSSSDLLNKEQIKTLSHDFEIGAHTITHPLLSKINEDTAKREILDSKEYLERITNKKVTSFCFPSGDYDQTHKDIVKEAGFSLSRTTERFKTDIGVDHFALPTTIHAYRHWSDAFSILKEVGLSQFIKAYLNWDELAIISFNKAKETGGVFHLWGHSWEIEKNNDWERLERVLSYISNRPEVGYITNAEMI